MNIENARRVKRVKMIFYPGAGICALASLLFFLLGIDAGGFIMALFLVVWFLLFLYIDFQYISFEVKQGRVYLRYFSVVRFGSKNYSSIEFPQEFLHDYRIEKSAFGRVNDLILVIRTKKGIAEYPPVSMAALDKVQEESILGQLRLLKEQ